MKHFIFILISLYSFTAYSQADSADYSKMEIILVKTIVNKGFHVKKNKTIKARANDHKYCGLYSVIDSSTIAIGLDTLLISDINEISVYNSRRRLRLAAIGLVAAGVVFPVFFVAAYFSDLIILAVPAFSAILFGGPTVLISVPGIFLRKKHKIGSKWSIIIQQAPVWKPFK